ncbi:MAG TPA: hypothetical protein VL180_14075 [Burkholderiales bacterium]|jgi:hypothetical protein|nr:hypothetical protein [Burkholderiales bacterium]
MTRRAHLAVCLAALLLPPAWTVAQEPEGAAPDEQQQAEDREHAQRIRRAIDELEARRTESARRLEADLFRQAEIRKLEDARAAIGRRESYLGGEIYWTQRERDSLQWRDPTDLSAFSRRSTLDHQMYQYSNELERAGTQRLGVTNQLNSLQRR